MGQRQSSGWVRLLQWLRVDRNGQRVPLIRNYPLQYAAVGTPFLVVGIALSLLGNMTGLGLAAFGLVAYGFAALYYFR